MLEVATWVLTMLIGHVVTDLSFYSVHRWVLHGWLGRLGPLTSLAEQHRYHHARPLDVGGLLFTPVVNWVLLFVGCLFLYLSAPFGIGYITYVTLYSWRHGRSHLFAPDSVSMHHLVHHLVSPKKNFDIVYPLTDIIMGTYLKAEGSIKSHIDDDETEETSH